MYKSVRYYFKNKSTEKKEAKKRRQYIGLDREFLDAIDIQINNNFNNLNRELIITTNINILNNLNGNYALCLFIMEDSIIAPQDDEKFGYIENYVHDHIYRCSVNDIYGESINAKKDILSNLESDSFF